MVAVTVGVAVVVGAPVVSAVAVVVEAAVVPVVVGASVGGELVVGTGANRPGVTGEGTPLGLSAAVAVVVML